MERGFQQGRRHLHGRCHPHQYQLRHPLRRPGGGLQGHQRAKAVPDQNRPGQAGSVHQRHNEVGRRLYRGWRLAGAAAVTRQIDGQHVPAVVGQVARLQNPDTVVVQHAMDKDDAGLGGIEGFAAGVAVAGLAIDGDEHGWGLGNWVNGRESNVCPG